MPNSREAAPLAPRQAKPVHWPQVGPYGEPRARWPQGLTHLKRQQGSGVITIYLVLVMLTLPAPPAQQGSTVELHRELITASSPHVCNSHAEKVAAQQRQRHAETVKRLNAKVVGSCVAQGAMQ